jgi:glycosyltransferase involved in cell wall biosynthesis
MTAAAKRILLYDPIPGGHHAEYIAHLVRLRERYSCASRLIVAVSPNLLDSSPELVSLLKEENSGLVDVELVSNLDASSLRELARQQAEGFESVVRRVRPTHAIGMYGDHLQIGLTLGLRFAFPVSLYGILFRPTFHYNEFNEPPEGIKEALSRSAKRLLIRGALRNRHFRSYLTLDPVAARLGKERWGDERFVHLPDPVDASVVKDWQWSSARPGDRKTLLVFGVLDDRKGLVPLFEAIEMLSASDQGRLCIQMAGVIPEGMDHIRARIQRWRESAKVSVMFADERVPDDYIQSLISQADLVSLLYQKEHVGSSGVLIRSAAAGVPVMATDRGLIGHYVSKNRLGIAVDSLNPYAIRDALRRWLTGDSIQWNRQSASMFSAQHTPDAFACKIYQTLL